MQRQRSIQLVGFLLAFALAAAGAVVTTIWASRNSSSLKPWAYPYFWLPVLFAALPFRWPRRSGLSAGLLVGYVFSPLSLSVGILFIPAAIVMLLLWLLDRRGLSSHYSVMPSNSTELK